MRVQCPTVHLDIFSRVPPFSDGRTKSAPSVIDFCPRRRQSRCKMSSFLLKFRYDSMLYPVTTGAACAKPPCKPEPPSRPRGRTPTAALPTSVGNSSSLTWPSTEWHSKNIYKKGNFPRGNRGTVGFSRKQWQSGMQSRAPEELSVPLMIRCSAKWCSVNLRSDRDSRDTLSGYQCR